MWHDKNTHKKLNDGINNYKNDLIKKLSEYKTFNCTSGANQGWPMLRLEIHIFIGKRLLKDPEVFFLKKIVGYKYNTLLKLKNSRHASKQYQKSCNE